MATTSPREIYGVWALRPFGYERERHEDDPQDPHLLLYFRDPQNPRRAEFKYNVAINVKSKGFPSELVYAIQDPFDHQPTIKVLEELDLGFHAATGVPDTPVATSSLSLDYLRTPDLISITKTGKILPHDVPGPNNDLLDSLEPVIQAAIRNQSKMYIFGFRYRDGKGLHKVHMNQGSVGSFASQNAVGKDGAIIIHDVSGWKAVFLAFASQKVPTDGIKGNPEPGAKSLEELI
ncbi:hypothetical protein B0A52_08499 [Exophiala mesophila]|uniref:Uncharacterized protein n=1 Tax=Exophiala mesophila TaxID=212818 RepID=A0A438MVV4_EXOME|nr:hypothetical protein B0A52_08499 [Exophiala mesophila]